MFQLFITTYYVIQGGSVEIVSLVAMDSVM